MGEVVVDGKKTYNRNPIKRAYLVEVSLCISVQKIKKISTWWKEKQALKTTFFYVFGIKKKCQALELQGVLVTVPQKMKASPFQKAFQLMKDLSKCCTTGLLTLLGSSK